MADRQHNGFGRWFFIKIDMATITYHNVGIKAMSACVPPRIAYNRDLNAIMEQEEVDKMINAVGIHERRICEAEVSASEICYNAAKQLMEDNDVDPQSIDVLLFMSQTSDYRMPATSCILQHRLNLPKSCACMDLSLGCSGYVYALSTAFAYASMEGVRRVLLLDGETFSKVVNPKDKVNAPLYGDAGTATLIEKGDYKDSIFVLNSDGSGADSVKIPAGMRNPVTADSVVEKVREDNNVRSDMEVYMDGMDVFNFAISVVPKSIKEIAKTAGVELGDIDYLLFHQSNRFMTDFFVKRLKFDEKKVPYCISKYGNTSSVSIPLTIVSELEHKMEGEKQVIMCGFGAGLSWGTALIHYQDCHISPIMTY